MFQLTKFVAATFVVWIVFSVPFFAVGSDVGKKFPSERMTWIDPITEKTLTVLTRSSFNDMKPYQTHTTWTADGQWIVFRSNRSNRGPQIFLVEENSGTIVQITDSPAVNTATINLSRKAMTLFYLRGNGRTLPRQLIEVNLGTLLADTMSGNLKEPTTYERLVATLPPDGDSVSVALDADETRLYWGVILARLTPEQQEELRRTGKDPHTSEGWHSRISSIDVKTGELKTVLDMKFRVGHVQTNPWVPGEIVYCHETGGHAPQRIWSVKADGSGNRPIYVETPDEWVTHEVFSGPDEVMFILSGNMAKQQEKPTGVAVVDLRTNRMLLLGQTGLSVDCAWHCTGSPDGQWASLDTRRGCVFVIRRANGERIRLTAGHPQRPDHTHPIFSPDSKRVLIQTGIFNGGESLDLITVDVP
jgi:oligogalacturonide lyase